jgi:hypothetical protein
MSALRCVSYIYIQVVNVVPGGYLEGHAHLELVVQHAVADCAAEDVRPDLVSNVQLVSAQGLELSHPHLLSSVPAGGITEHTHVLTYEVAADEASCTHVKQQVEKCALSEGIAHFAEQYAAGRLGRALAADSAQRGSVKESEVGGGSDRSDMSILVGASVLMLLLSAATVLALRSCGTGKSITAGSASATVAPSVSSSRC